MRTNVAAEDTRPRAHEGGIAGRSTPLMELERAIATTFLFEDSFYEGGASIAERIAKLCDEIPLEDVARLAIKARHEDKLRHVPLWLCRQLLRLHSGSIVGDTIGRVVSRPDEAAELVALYWKDKRTPLRAQLKRGIGIAFQKWDAYQLAKWDRGDKIKLRDVLFLCHPAPKDEAQAELWKQLVNKTLPAPLTWEVELSKGADPKKTWEMLLTEKRLGYMALLQNLRNMTEAKVERSLIVDALLAGAPKSWALPFRFISAAKAAPGFAGELSDAMVLAAKGEPLAGSTAVVVDVSGSMDSGMAGRSKLQRYEAAAGLAVLVREQCRDCRVFTFSYELKEVPNLRGLGLVTGISQSQDHGATYLARALDVLRASIPAPERLVVVTDEQSSDGLGVPFAKRNYLINVAAYQNGLDLSGGWVRFSGWSERIVDFVRAHEALETDAGLAQ